MPDPCDAAGASACVSSVGIFTCTCNTDYRGSTCEQPPQYITTVSVPINMPIDGLTESVFDGMASLESTIEQATIDKGIDNYIDDSFGNYAAVFSSNVAMTDPAVAGIQITFDFQITSTTSGANRRRKRRSLTAAEQAALTSSLGDVASDPSITSAAAASSGLTVTTPAAPTVTASKAADVDACHSGLEWVPKVSYLGVKHSL